MLVISEAQADALLKVVRGGFRLTWAVVDGVGNQYMDNVLKEGRFVVAEDQIDYTIALVCKNDQGELFLVPCKQEDF
jgi:hypothetical protein